MRYSKLAASAVIAAAVSLSATAANADTVIFTKQGMIQDAYTTLIDLDSPGTYDLVYSSSSDAYYTFQFGYENHWDTFVAPAPKPHGAYITGNNQDQHVTGSSTGTAYSYTFVVPEMYRTYFTSDASYVPYGVAVGTEMYYEQRYENPYIRAQIWPISFANGNFSFTVTRRDAVPGEGVPEPSSWALLILGFAGVGGALRRRARMALG